MTEDADFLPLERAQKLLKLKVDPTTHLTSMEEEVAFARLVSKRDGIIALVRRRTGCSEDEAQTMLENIQDVMSDGKIRTAAGVADEFGVAVGQATRQMAVVEAVLMADWQYRLDAGVAYQMMIED
jgi:hypothetical protein